MENFLFESQTPLRGHFNAWYEFGKEKPEQLKKLLESGFPDVPSHKLLFAAGRIFQGHDDLLSLQNTPDNPVQLSQVREFFDQVEHVLAPVTPLQLLAWTNHLIPPGSLTYQFEFCQKIQDQFNQWSSSHLEQLHLTLSDVDPNEHLTRVLTIEPMIPLEILACILELLRLPLQELLEFRQWLVALRSRALLVAVQLLQLEPMVLIDLKLRFGSITEQQGEQQPSKKQKTVTVIDSLQKAEEDERTETLWLHTKVQSDSLFPSLLSDDAIPLSDDFSDNQSFESSSVVGSTLDELNDRSEADPLLGSEKSEEIHQASDTLKLRVARQPPDRIVYQRILKPYPSVMFVDLPPNMNKAEFFVEVSLLRCDSDADISDHFDGTKMERFTNGAIATFKKLKITSTSHHLSSLFKLKFVLKRFLGNHFELFPSATVFSSPIEVVSHPIYIKKKNDLPLPPVISEVIPNQSVVGSRVAILGANFIGGPKLKIKFGNKEISPQFHEGGTLLCTIPDQEDKSFAGKVVLRVANDGVHYCHSVVTFEYTNKLPVHYLHFSVRKFCKFYQEKEMKRFREGHSKSEGIQVNEESVSSKKLVLNDKFIPEELWMHIFQETAELQKRKAWNEIFQWLPLPDGAFLKGFSSLRQQLKLEKGSDIVEIILKVLGKLTPQIQMEVGLLLEIVTPFIINPKNSLVLFQAMQILLRLVQNSLIFRLIIQKKLFVHYSPLIRCHSLLILAYSATEIGMLQILSLILQEQIEAVYAILEGSLQDLDPRVRRNSIVGFRILYRRNIKLKITSYEIFQEGLRDNYEFVRIETIKLIRDTSTLHGDKVIKTHYGKVRLLDDSFTKTCICITDIYTSVRTMAASFLGNFQDVGNSFILQTLGKEVLAGKSKGEITLARGRQTLNQDSKQSNVVSDQDVSLLDSGAVGVFIEALEDEFYAVRSAALDSICELAIINKDFANIAVEYIVDMFNDEIEEVRINAINSLNKIGENIILTEAQLHTVLSVLDDLSSSIRKAVFHLLKRTSLSSSISLQATVEALLACYQKYPRDFLEIFQALKGMGENNAVFVELLVESLLNVNSQFMMPEPHVDDIFYIFKLIVIYNALQKNSKIETKLPYFVFKHFVYLREKYPQVFPQTESALELLKLETGLKQAVDKVYWRDQFKAISLNFQQDLVEQINAKSSIKARTMISFIKSKLGDLKKWAPFLKGNIQFLQSFVEILEHLLKMKSQFDPSSLRETPTNVGLLTYTLEHNYLGLPRSIKKSLKEIRIVNHILWLQLTQDIEGRDWLEQVSLLKERIQSYILYCEDFELIPLELFKTKIETPMEFIQNVLQNYQVPVLHTENLLKKIKAKILFPSSNLEKPLELVAPFPFKVDLEVDLIDWEFPHLAYVKITTPDDRTGVQMPIPSSFQFSSQSTFKLKHSTTLIPVKPYNVDVKKYQFQVVRRIPLDSPLDYAFLNIAKLLRAAPQANSTLANVSSLATSHIGYVATSKPLTFCVHFQSKKK